MTQSPQEIVIPSGAGRRFFFPSRSCELVGLRSEDRFLFARFLREESLFAFCLCLCRGRASARPVFDWESAHSKPFDGASSPHTQNRRMWAGGAGL